MTEKEAIKEVKRWTSILMSAGSECVSDTAEAQDMVINALEEVEQYRAIGTPEEFRDALEKQIPQPPIVRGLGQRYCPTCKCGGANDLYCSKCGQKLRD